MEDKREAIRLEDLVPPRAVRLNTTYVRSSPSFYTPLGVDKIPTLGKSPQLKKASAVVRECESVSVGSNSLPVKRRFVFGLYRSGVFVGVELILLLITTSLLRITNYYFIGM